MNLKTNLLCKIAVLSSLLACCAAAPAQDKLSYKITGLKISTYNQHKNSFKDISDEKDAEFWNALGISVFIAVEVTAKPNTYNSGRRVEILIYNGRKLVLKRLGRVGYFRDDKFYVPAFLYGSFCQTVTIKARITGQREVSTITKNLNFACGE